MKVNKQAKRPTIAVGDLALKPLSENEYPMLLEHNGIEYYRLWILPKIITYQMWDGKNWVGYYVMPHKQFFGTFDLMEQFVEANKNDYTLKLIAR